MGRVKNLSRYGESEKKKTKTLVIISKHSPKTTVWLNGLQKLSFMGTSACLSSTFVGWT